MILGEGQTGDALVHSWDSEWAGSCPGPQSSLSLDNSRIVLVSAKLNNISEPLKPSRGDEINNVEELTVFTEN